MAPSHGTDGESLTQALLDDSDFLRRIVERALQQVLDAEMTAHVGAERYERTETRTGQRNGYRPRTLHTRVGTLTLLVPQDREGTLSMALFARYQRSETALVTALMEMYLEGVSTRTALCAEQSDEWISGMRYLDVSELRRSQQEQGGEEVTLTAV